MIISGGPIVTMAGDEPQYVEAVAVDDGKIVYAGDLAGVEPFRGGDTVEKDLGGKTLLPGFVDAHGHMVMGGLPALSANMLAPPDGEITDIPDMVATLKKWAADNADAVKKANVIIGFGYDNAQLKELRHPTKEELDEVSNDVPVIIVHQSGHLASVNTAAFALVGYDASTEDPEGGVIQRKPCTQELNGTLEETAFFPVIGKALEGVGAIGIETFAREGARAWTKYGYTTAQEARSVPPIVEVLKKLAGENQFNIDVITFPDVLVDRDYILANYSPTYTNHFRVGGAKLTIDGSPQGFTAWCDQPYYDPVGNYPAGYKGYAAAPEKDVMDPIEWAFDNDVQIITHANGEAASDLLIKAVDAAEKHHTYVDQRPVLIHGEFLREDQVDSFQRLHIIPSLFPMHTFYWGDWHCEHTVGPKLCPNISPTGWVRARGMIFTTHHDAPVALPDSIRVLSATVNRTSRTGKPIGPDQRVDAYTALRAMTIWSAFQINEEKTKSSIETGNLADFIVLSDDPLKVARRRSTSSRCSKRSRKARPSTTPARTAAHRSRHPHPARLTGSGRLRAEFRIGTRPRSKKDERF
ncbi:amidohydrolase family protein [Altererythrobacter salegens]|uniref:Amidohydrolase family protein n=1 Tax=Croceibacterium salegens TaxID=1737568 RepID=A0A6I4SVH6_9SPHN|nr:amidohydrolase [Croceibacterium salegens]MXO60045.1 amidohydrolase family protein [Croceibacterium salegens]